MDKQSTDLAAVEGLDTFLTVKKVAAHVGVSVSSVWRMARENEFPKPIKLSSQVTRWRKSEVQEWMAQDFPKAL